MNRITVGVDGSASAEEALRWAVSAASCHDAHLTAIMAWSYLDQHHIDGTEHFDPAYGEKAATEALQAAVDRVSPARHVELQVVCELPARALVEAGSSTDLLVVGARGVGGFAGLRLGSVSERVLEHAPVPVAVVREGAARRPVDAAVVVGIDGSGASMGALQWAAREAEARAATLHVVHAWQVTSLGVPPTDSVVSLTEEAARRVLDRALEHPSLTGVDVEGHLWCGTAAQRLLDLSADAAVLVVGTRGLGTFARMLLGSTSRQLAHHASCPVVVVPASSTPQEGGGR